VIVNAPTVAKLRIATAVWEEKLQLADDTPKPNQIEFFGDDTNC